MPRLSLLVVSISFLLYGCSDRGTCPTTVQTRVYLSVSYTADSTWNSERLYRIHILGTDSLNSVQYIEVPELCMPAELRISPDGNWLYARNGELWKINALSGSVAWATARHYASLAFPTLSLLQHGKTILCANEMFNSDGGTKLRSIPDSLHLGYAPEPGCQVPAVVADTGDWLGTQSSSDTIITIVDVTTGATHSSFIPRLRNGLALHPFYIRLHPDGKRILGIGGATENPGESLLDPGYSWFFVCDAETGETLLEHNMTYPFGEVAISSDGLTVAASDPSYIFWYDSITTLDIFDLGAMKHLHRFQYDRWGKPFFGQIRFLPGDKRLLICPPTWGYGPLHIADLELMALVDTISVAFPNCQIGPIALGPRP